MPSGCIGLLGEAGWTTTYNIEGGRGSHWGLQLICVNCIVLTYSFSLSCNVCSYYDVCSATQFDIPK